MMQPIRRLPANLYYAIGLSLLSLLLAGCAGDPFGSGRTIFQVSLVTVSGDDQVVPSGGVESAPLVVRVVDQRGTALRDVTVDWKVAQGDGTLSTASSRTDSNGQAQVTYTSGSTAGAAEITATASFTSDGLSAGRPVPPVSFKLTVSSTTDSVALDDE